MEEALDDPCRNGALIRFHDVTKIYPLPGGDVLQYATNLQATNWMPASPPPVVANGENVVTNALAGGAAFYRLYRP